MQNIESFMRRAATGNGNPCGAPVTLVVEQDGNKFVARVADATDHTAPVSFESDWDRFAEADGTTVADALANLDALCAADEQAVA